MALIFYLWMGLVAVTPAYAKAKPKKDTAAVKKCATEIVIFSGYYTCVTEADESYLAHGAETGAYEKVSKLYMVQTDREADAMAAGWPKPAAALVKSLKPLVKKFAADEAKIQTAILGDITVPAYEAEFNLRAEYGIALIRGMKDSKPLSTSPAGSKDDLNAAEQDLNAKWAHVNELLSERPKDLEAVKTSQDEWLHLREEWGKLYLSRYKDAGIAPADLETAIRTKLTQQRAADLDVYPPKL